MTVTVTPVATKADREAFVDLIYTLNAGDPNFVPQLRAEELEKFTPGENPFFEHARVQLFLARRGGDLVGRISAHIDELAIAQPPEQGFGPGTGMWGAIEAADEEAAQALIAAAEAWLREQGMTLQQIANQLNGMGVGANWSPTKVSRALARLA